MNKKEKDTQKKPPKKETAAKDTAKANESAAPEEAEKKNPFSRKTRFSRSWMKRRTGCFA